jgi:hypothetical protein
MAVTAKFTEQIVVLVTKETRAELEELADVAEESLSKVIRDCVTEGLPRVAKRLKGGSGR